MDAAIVTIKQKVNYEFLSCNNKNEQFNIQQKGNEGSKVRKYKNLELITNKAVFPFRNSRKNAEKYKAKTPLQKRHKQLIWYQKPPFFKESIAVSTLFYTEERNKQA